jgi:iron complex outermembrane receptor protein
VLSVELLATESYIDALNPPQIFGAQTDYDKLNPGVRKPLFITKTSKWYPGGSGGVPAVAGVTGQDLALTWSMDELGPAQTDDRQHTTRVVVNDEGVIGAWDYRVGFNAAQSRRDVGWKNGFVTTPELYAGVANGTLNPFGKQDDAGQAYLDNISVDGKTYRSARVRYFGPDFNVSRPLMELGGGSLAIAVGGDLHRELYEDHVDMLTNSVVYKVSGSPGANPSGARTVAGLYAEIDAPITKTLDLTGAVRYDRFSDFGSTVNPKLSVRWEAHKNVMLRATASTGFRAPTLPELYGTPQVRTPSTNRWDDPLLCPSATPSVANTGSVTKDPKLRGPEPRPGHRLQHHADHPDRRQSGPEAGKVEDLHRRHRHRADQERDGLVRLLGHRMKGTIAQQTEDTIFSDPAKYQNLFVRQPDGRLDYIVVTRQNMGGLHTQGVDTTFNYAIPTAKSMGKFGIALDGSYTRQVRGPERRRRRVAGQRRPAGRAGDRLDLGQHLHLPLAPQPAPVVGVQGLRRDADPAMDLALHRHQRAGHPEAGPALLQRDLAVQAVQPEHQLQVQRAPAGQLRHQQPVRRRSAAVEPAPVVARGVRPERRQADRPHLGEPRRVHVLMAGR